jgi:hypothetical protein
VTFENKGKTTLVAKKTAGGKRSAVSGGRTTLLADVRVAVPDVGEVAVLQAKAANVVQHLGGPTAVARHLRVAKSQPGRWVRGTEAPSAESTKHLLDLEYVLSRLEQLYEPDAARTAGGRADNPQHYQALYVSESPQGAVGEAFGDLAVWSEAMFAVPWLQGAERALATFETGLCVWLCV